MKSYIKKMIDYKTIPFEKKVVIIPLEPYEIEERMHEVSKRRKKTLHPETIEYGDEVTLLAESEDIRFQGETTVIPGNFLFDTCLEKAMIGKKAGETIEAASHSGSTVKMSILKVTRTIYPDPTLKELAKAAENYDEPVNFSSKEEYASYLQEENSQKQREEAVYEIIQRIMDAVFEESDLVLDQEEVQQMYDQAWEELDEELQDQIDKSLDQLTDEEIEDFIGPSDRKELEEQLQSNAISQLASALFFGYIQELPADQIDPDDPELMDYGILEDYVLDMISFVEE